jgi:glyoxylase-like metal-dependent hydrolase (beta-lactamase superfamily II)
MERVERIEIPTPFGIGQVNCYAFVGDGLVLLDPGPKTDDALEALRAGLERVDRALADVDRVLVTHPHMDHYGLAARARAESGADVLAPEAAVDRLADPDAHLEREQTFFRPFLVEMGVPEELVDTVVGLPEPFTEFRDPVAVDRALADGDAVDVGPGFRTVHTPGHTPDSVCYVAASEDVAFTGDHVMMEVSPNPLLTVVPGAEDERTRSLPAYLESLRKIRDVEATVGHAGHRDRIPDLAGRATEIIEHHGEREERIADLVAKAGDATAYGLMKRLFPDLPATEMFPGMSEVIGHLDLLEDEDRVDVETVDGVRRYRLA